VILGLSALVQQEMGCNPLDGTLYVFVSRRGTQVRVLYFDRSGFGIWAKRDDVPIVAQI